MPIDSGCLSLWREIWSLIQYVESRITIGAERLKTWLEDCGTIPHMATTIPGSFLSSYLRLEQFSAHIHKQWPMGNLKRCCQSHVYFYAQKGLLTSWLYMPLCGVGVSGHQPQTRCTKPKTKYNKTRGSSYFELEKRHRKMCPFLGAHASRYIIHRLHTNKCFVFNATRANLISIIGVGLQPFLSNFWPLKPHPTKELGF